MHIQGSNIDCIKPVGLSPLLGRLSSGQLAGVRRRTHAHKIFNALPNQGKVDIICITDKQYENIISYSGRTKSKQKTVNKQYLLF